MAPIAAASADTFPKLLIRNAQLYGAHPAMRHKDLGIWQTWTWAQELEIVRAYAVGYQLPHIVPGSSQYRIDPVAINSFQVVSAHPVIAF